MSTAFQKAEAKAPCICRVCGKPARKVYCSRGCSLVAKVIQTRSRRPLKDHVCQCKWCGKKFNLGRPRKPIPEKVGRL